MTRPRPHRAAISSLMACALVLAAFGCTQPDALQHRTTAQAAFPGENGKIAFVRRPSLAFEIYVADSDGSSPVPILSGEGNYREPQWSPDGSRLVFVHQNGPTNRIMVWNAADGSTEDLRDGWSPTFSPDGTRIMFLSGSPADIWVMDADGTNAVRIVETPEHEAWPAWSPDGTRIAFSRFVPSVSFWRMFLANAEDPSAEVQLTTFDGGRGWMPNFSPDGTRVAYVMTGTFNGQGEIYVASTTGAGTPLNLTNTTFGEVEPAWSPDGTRIAYTRREPAGSTETSRIWSVNADGTGAAQLIGGEFTDSQASWQPATEATPVPSVLIYPGQGETVSFAIEDRPDSPDGSDQDANDTVVQMCLAYYVAPDQPTTANGLPIVGIDAWYNFQHVGGAAYNSFRFDHTFDIPFAAAQGCRFERRYTNLDNGQAPVEIEVVESDHPFVADRGRVRVNVVENPRQVFDDGDGQPDGFVNTVPTDEGWSRNRMVNIRATCDVSADQPLLLSNPQGDLFGVRNGTGALSGAPGTAVEVHAAGHGLPQHFSDDGNAGVPTIMANGAAPGFVVPRPSWAPPAEYLNIADPLAYASIMSASDWYDVPGPAVYTGDVDGNPPPAFRALPDSPCSAFVEPEPECDAEHPCESGQCVDGFCVNR